MPGLLKFDIPPNVGIFDLFTRLPIELQDAIWSTTISDPGIHFLRIETTPPAGPWGIWWPRDMVAPKSVDDPGDDGVEEDIKDDDMLLKIPASLSPTETNPLADKSHHTVARDELKRLSLVSRKARDCMESHVRARGSLSLARHGRLTMLAKATDIVLLEYLPPKLYQSSCCLGVIFDSSKLRNIKQVALRYNHEWTLADSRGLCPWCAITHFYLAGRPVRPRHLYQFLARSFPELEEVWLVDYLMLPKPTADAGGQRTSINSRCSRSFRARDRTFYEASEETWNIKPGVRRMVDWVQDQYVRYSNRSDKAHHENPEKVRFGLLGCRWDIASLEVTQAKEVAASGKGGGGNKRQADGKPSRGRLMRRRLARGLRDTAAQAPDRCEGSPALDFGCGKFDDFAFNFDPSFRWDLFASRPGR